MVQPSSAASANSAALTSTLVSGKSSKAVTHLGLADQGRMNRSPMKADGPLAPSHDDGLVAARVAARPAHLDARDELLVAIGRPRVAPTAREMRRSACS